VTDERGIDREYVVESEGGVTSVTAAVPKGDVVRGAQTHVITYGERDVGDSFADTGAEEFCWNLNGTDRAQHFARVSERVVLGHGLADALTSDQLACCRGAEGSIETCTIGREGDAVVGQLELFRV